MRNNPTAIIEAGRITDGPYGTRHDSGIEGAYVVDSPFGAALLRMIASSSAELESEGWEHVSVSVFNRCPVWDEMQWVKEQFWHGHEVCFQLHPDKKNYKNIHPFCLHIWRHTKFPVPTPPNIFVG